MLTLGGGREVTDCSNIFFPSLPVIIKMKFAGYILMNGKKLWVGKIYKYYKNAERVKETDEKRFDVRLKIVENFIK